MSEIQGYILRRKENQNVAGWSYAEMEPDPEGGWYSSEDVDPRIAKLEAENADVRHKNHTLFDEVEKEREEKAELRDQRGHKHYLLTQAVEFLRRYLNDKFYADVAEFLSEMEDTHE